MQIRATFLPTFFFWCALGASAQAQVNQLISSNHLGYTEWYPSTFAAMNGDGSLVAFQTIALLVPADNNFWSDIYLRDRRTNQLSLVSVSLTGGPANSTSDEAVFSRDGTCLVFRSMGSDIVVGDTNSRADMFLLELQTSVITRVSLGSGGLQANDHSAWPGVSANGRFVAFNSSATNLVPGDTNGWNDIFVHDRQTGITTRESVSSSGAQADLDTLELALSDDGRFVAFMSLATNLVPGDTNQRADIFVHDRQSGATTRVNVDDAGNQASPSSWSGDPKISADGRFVAFWSNAANLVPGDTNGFDDTFVHDCVNGTTIRVSVDASGVEGNAPSNVSSITPDGRFVAFASQARNFVPGINLFLMNIFVRDLWTNTITCASTTAAGGPANGDSFIPVISNDGRVVAFESTAVLDPGDGNIHRDIYAHDCQCSNAFGYCTAKSNSLGCTPTIFALGASSASATSGFTLGANAELNNKRGVLLLGGSGRAAVPFQGGTLCVASPARTPILSSGGTPGPALDCSGHFSIDVNTYAAGVLGGHPASFLKTIGLVIDCQWWSRDPGFAWNAASSLTAGLEYVVGP
ncbi:MAG TPA: calcium-binding protein [Planctomycetota bacterium]|nr:calcium-binding protein [Planctomycetota bacterium]